MKFMEFLNGLLMNWCGLFCVILSPDQSYCHRLQHDTYFLTSTSRLNEQVVDKIILQLNRVYPQILTNEEAEKVIWGVLLCLWLLCRFYGLLAQLPSSQHDSWCHMQPVCLTSCLLSTWIWHLTCEEQSQGWSVPCAKWSWGRALWSSSWMPQSLPWWGARSAWAGGCSSCDRMPGMPVPSHEGVWSGTVCVCAASISAHKIIYINSITFGNQLITLSIGRELRGC